MKDKVGIAFITTAFYPLFGGAEVQLKNLAHYLSRQGFDLTVYTYSIEGVVSKETVDGMEVVRLKVFNRGKLAPISFLLSVGVKLFKHRKRYSIFQGHQLPMGIIAGIMGRLLKKKTVAKIEGMDDILRYKGAKIKTAILHKFIDRVISLGNSTTKELISLGIPEEKIVYIPNAFDSSYAQEIQKDDKENRVLFVGRLEYEKAPDVLLKAWQIVLKDHPDAELIMLGDGKERAELKGLLIEFGISDSVKMKGTVNNVRDYLLEASVFVLPSRIEGVPIAMLEAMAAGVPVVVTPVGDIPDIIKDSENGIFVKPDDIEGLAETISELLSHPEKRKSLAKKAQTTVRDFSIDKAGKKYIELYKELLNEKKD